MRKKEKANPSWQGKGQAQINNKYTILGGNKSEHPVSNLKAYFFLQKKQEKLGLPPSSILPFPDAKLILSSMLHLNKDETFAVLKELASLGFLEIVNSHGVRLLKNQQGRN